MTLLDYVRSITHEDGTKRNGSWWFHSPFRSDSSASLQVSEHKGKWHDWGSGEYGDLIDLVRKYEGCDFLRAKDIVGDYIKPTILPQQPTLVRQYNTSAYTDNRLIDYANKRGVKTSILAKYTMQLNDRKFTYIALPNEMGGYAVRNLHFKGQKGANSFSFFRGQFDNDILVFEGMFDFLSYFSLSAVKYSAVVLNTTANTKKALEVLRMAKSVHLFLDNDEGGRSATAEITKSIPHAIDHANYYSNCNDVNEYICNYRK
jgi:DNA primase